MKKDLFTFKIPILIFCSTLLIYISVLPNINTGYADGDELIAAAHSFGVPHPPSYPLYTFLAGVFGALPIPFLTFAGKVNLLNSIFQAATASFIYLCAYFLLFKLIKQPSIRALLGIFAALLLAFSPSFFLYALITEVFSMNNLFASLVSFLLILWAHKRAQSKGKYNSLKLLLTAALIFGLGISNQQILILLAPVFVYWVLSTQKELFFNGKLIIFSIILFFAGFLGPYIYLPLAAQNQSTINWENPKTLNGIYRSITRRVYAEVSPIGHSYIETRIDWRETPKDLERYFSFFVTEFTLPVFLLSLLGLIFLLYKKNYKIFLFLTLGIIGGGMFFSVYSPFLIQKDYIYYSTHLGIYQRFFFLSTLYFVLLMTFGVAALYTFIRDYLLPLFNLEPTFFEKNNLKKAFLASILLIPLFLGSSSYSEIKNNHFEAAREFGIAFLNSLEPNAIVLCYSEQTCFTGVYLQEVENIRKDVIILQVGFVQMTLDQFKQRYPGLIKTNTPRASTAFATLIIRDLIRWNIDKRPLYVAGINNDPTFLSAHGLKGDPFFMIPNGCALKIEKNFRLIPQSLECQKLTNTYLNSSFSKKLSITDMFPSYMAYQHFITAFQYLDFNCPENAPVELESAGLLSPQFYGSVDALLELQKQPDKNKCQELTPGPKLSELLTQSEESGKNDDLENALYYQVQAASLDPQNISIRLKLADLYIKRKAFNNAVLEYTDILTLDPENQTAKKGLSSLDNVYE